MRPKTVSRSKKKNKNNTLAIVLLISVLVLAVIAVISISQAQKRQAQSQTSALDTQPQTMTQPTLPLQSEPMTMSPYLSGSDIIVDYLPVNKFSRPGTKLEHVNGVVVHYVGNPDTTAMSNREYFASLAQTGETSASSHYIIGLEGEILQCVPLTEISYCSNNRNWDTIAIECCHPDVEGKFNPSTYHSLVKLCSALCLSYGLNPKTDVIRHYDVTGKECPRYYVIHEDEWEVFLQDVSNEMQQSH